MKKLYFLLLTIFSLVISGCTIIYSNNTEDIPQEDNNENNDNNSGNDNEENTGENGDSTDNNNQGNNPEGDDNNGEQSPPNDNTEPDDKNDNQEDETPPVTELVIDEEALLYPYNLSLNDSKITNYTYIDSNLTNKYKIYSAYYSEIYDTIYIAYDSIFSPSQTLKAKDLYEIEKHAINYFISDQNRSEDKNYLKAVRIYPDRLASSCRKGLSDANANNINGCADYGGKEAIIDLNITNSLDDFYNPKTVPTGSFSYIEYEPMRDTFAHEYGHISTFYHMAYKNDENYEEYLKMRLGNYYNTIYPSGLPAYYSSSSSYSIQPEEILADDFVELFYNTTIKKENDTYDYSLQYDDQRNSLSSYSSIQFLKQNDIIYTNLTNYYSLFLDYSNRIEYEKPIVISSSNKTINYYESYSHIGNINKQKTINSKINVNLIATGSVTINGIQYYRVILSNTVKLTNGTCDRKAVSKMFGYVKVSNYTLNKTIKLYKIDQVNGQPLEKNSIIPIENNINKLYILPFYDFSYVLNTTNDSNYATMYDYLNSNLSSSQTYKVNIYSFGSLIS